MKISDSLNLRETVPVGAIIPWLGGYFGNGSNGSFTNVLGNTVNDVNSYIPANWRVCDGAALDDAESPIFNGASKYLPNLTDDRFLMGATTAGGIGGENSTTLAEANLPSHTHGINHDHPSTSVTGTVGGSDGTHTHTYNDPGHDHNLPTTGLSLSGGGNNTPNNVDNALPRVVTHTATTDITILSGGSGHGHGHSLSVNLPNYTGSSQPTGSGTAFENRPKYLSVFYIMRVK